MNNIKKSDLILNCDICDMRELKESSIMNYEKIIINTNILLQNNSSKEMISKFSNVINSSTSISSEKEIILKENLIINQNSDIKEDCVYIITGNLIIEQNSKECIEKIMKLYALGSIKYPMSLENTLSNFVLDCKVITYPDDCLFLDDTIVIDDMFEYIAIEDALYFARNKIVLTNIDIEPLINKNLYFYTKELIVDKNIVKKVMPMFNKDVCITILKDNQCYFNGNTSLECSLIKRLGRSLFIDGNVFVNKDSDLKNIDTLTVNGNLDVIESRYDEILNMDIKYNKLNVVKGEIIENHGKFTLDNNTLENAIEGITIRNCGMVMIDKDVLVSNISTKLQLINCGYVECVKEQKGALQTISNSIGYLTTYEEKQERNDNIEDRNKGNVINSEFYVF